METQALEVRVLSARQINRLKCRKNCAQHRQCALHALAKRPKSGARGWVLITLRIRNLSESPLSLSADAWELADRAGISVAGAAVCEKQLPRTCVQADLWLFAPGTSAYTVLAFPATGAWPAEIICSEGGHLIRCPVPAEEISMEKPGKGAVVRLKKHGSVQIDSYTTYTTPDGDQRYIMIGSKRKRP